MSATASYTLSQDATFRGKVQVLLAKVAVSVQGEARGSMDPKEWRKRGIHATRVLENPLNWLNQTVFAIVQNDTITGSSTDSDIEFMISSTFSDVAGVTGEDIA
jgi:hypothetical protein